MGSRTYHAGLWVEAYSEVVRLDLAGVRSWQPAGDRMLKKYLEPANMRAATIATGRGNRR